MQDHRDNHHQAHGGNVRSGAGDDGADGVSGERSGARPGRESGWDTVPVRDAGADGSTHMVVAADGTVITDGYADITEHGVRPALRLNLADVLLTVPAATKAASAAPGPDALTALAAEEANTVWKLTLLDTADAFRLTQDGASLTASRA